MTESYGGNITKLRQVCGEERNLDLGLRSRQEKLITMILIPKRLKSYE
jgi:hypothetical protein